MSFQRHSGDPQPVIRVEALSKRYQMGETIVHALREVSFQVAAGSFIALMGPSGSGKSTLMHLLGCLDTATSGHYWLNDRDVSQLSRMVRADVRNRHIGFVFQSFNLLARQTTLENVMLPLQYGRRTQTIVSARETATAALEQVGLADRLYHRPTELSGGQRQRVAIARALVGNPALILADEPTGNLDSRTGADILNLLQRLHAAGRTLIMVTHDAAVAAHAEEIFHMHDGQFVSAPDPGGRA